LDRTYLYVPPEEKVEVQAAGAHWDARLKCWYIGPGEDRARFARWLGARDGDPMLTIASDRAFVASAVTPCCRCGEPIEVICIYCETGTAAGEPLTRFTVTDVLAVDEVLARQLASWSGYRPIDDPDPDGPRYANHCPHCGAEQDDRDLHTEPGEPFFDIPHSAPSAVRLTPLTGQIRLSGDEHFTIE
jgi:Domain of unknown function (DUF5710)